MRSRAVFWLAIALVLLLGPVSAASASSVILAVEGMT
jgi:hypothetical protein